MFKPSVYLFVGSCWLIANQARAQSFDADVAPLIKSSCLRCHDADTQTRLNLVTLGHDFNDPATFRQWVKVFDRVHAGEMPPKRAEQPKPAELAKALSTLKQRLRENNLAVQKKEGRVPSRRLTRLEFENTLCDLLQIHDDLARMLPAESDSGGFDTVGSKQGISAVHIQSYLKAADQALDDAIRLGSSPSKSPRKVDYLHAPYVNRWFDLPINEGGSVIKKLDDAVAIFVDLDYLMRSDACGLQIRTPGYYRLTTEAYPYQAKKTVTLKLIASSEKRGGAQLLGAFDLQPQQTRKVEVVAFLYPGDFFYPSVASLDSKYGVYTVGAKKYKGSGVAIKSVLVHGPLVETWPPPSTQQLLTGTKLKENSGGTHEIELAKKPIDSVSDVVTRLAPLAFRRPAQREEVESFVALARPELEAGVKFKEAVRVPLRSMLSSPQFLFFQGEAGKLDDYALASRLSYFLWKSMPDAELFALAKDGKLTQPAVLDAQIDRMLKHEKANRFVSDFLGQWLRLNAINATTPDELLYPEFDDILNQAIVKETELFFAELIKENLGVSNLIDSNFTFLNRRLAEHYGMAEIKGQKISGQEFRKVTLPDDSPRGGVLTQASVLKTTANGTVTSPVRRGNFVLTCLLGTPPDPPPPNIGSIEPDTRGTTTIRETLAAHRNNASCATCHTKIDPPGFALESFDPIGGFRTKYRAMLENSNAPFFKFGPRTFKQGREVDSSGVTADGKSFKDIREFKKHLLLQKEQVARNFIAQLMIYSTGAEIQFADRDQVEAIVERLRTKDFPVRTILHEVVQSELFRNK
ncbi:DUF1592 domain-containing protein [soil metagenome]